MRAVEQKLRIRASELVLEKFEFRNQMSRLSKVYALGTLIERVLCSDISNHAF